MEVLFDEPHLPQVVRGLEVLEVVAAVDVDDVELAVLGRVALPGEPFVEHQVVLLSGKVIDSSGLVIPSAAITAANKATGADVTGFTGADGAYELTLEPGTYTVTVEMPGFEPGIANDVELIAGQPVLRNFTLELAAITTSIVVVGSRAEPRSVTESTVPVDVIRSEDFTSQGSTDLATQLRTVVPSFNINTQPISDAATVVRPANLRNLAPDHTLILVNGKRRHRAAVITWLGNGIADGSQGPDISIIPSIAIRQAEVLRGGAIRLGCHRRSHKLSTERRSLGRQSASQHRGLPRYQSGGHGDVRVGHHR